MTSKTTSDPAFLAAELIERQHEAIEAARLMVRSLESDENPDSNQSLLIRAAGWTDEELKFERTKWGFIESRQKTIDQYLNASGLTLVGESRKEKVEALAAAKEKRFGEINTELSPLRKQIDELTKKVAKLEREKKTIESAEKNISRYRYDLQTHNCLRSRRCHKIRSEEEKIYVGELESEWKKAQAAVHDASSHARWAASVKNTKDQGDPEYAVEEQKIRTRADNAKAKHEELKESFVLIDKKFRGAQQEFKSQFEDEFLDA